MLTLSEEELDWLSGQIPDAERSAKGRATAHRIGCTRVGKGVKIMILVDAKGLPVAACSTPADPAESHLIQQLFGFMISQTTPARVIGDKAYDSDRLDEFLAAHGVEMIAPNRLDRSQTQDGQSPSTLQTTLDWRTHHRMAPKLSTTLHSLGKISSRLPRFPSHGLRSLAHQGGFGIASSHES